MQQEFTETVYRIAQRLAPLPRLRAAIVFGSVARGEADARSDIDLLVVLEGTAAERKRLQKEIGKLLLGLERAHRKSIQVIYADPSFNGLDHQFVETVLREGIVLYGTLPVVRAGRLQLEPMALITYETHSCTQSQRTRIERVLYGYRTVKRHKGKQYRSRSEGLVKLLGGQKVGIAALLVPFRTAARFCGALRSNGATFRRIELWLSKR